MRVLCVVLVFVAILWAFVDTISECPGGWWDEEDD